MSNTLTTLRRPAKNGITLEAAKAALGVSGSASDVEILQMIEAATSRVEGVLNRPIRRGLYRETFRHDVDDVDLLLSVTPCAPLSVTSLDQSVAVLEIGQDTGLVTVERGQRQAKMGMLEPGAPFVDYVATYWGGWWLNEGPFSTDFDLVADVAAGAMEFELDASFFEDAFPAGATFSIGAEIVVATASAIADDVLTVSLAWELVESHDAGAAVYHVDERIPAAIVGEIMALVRSAWSAKSSAVGIEVASVSGDGYSATFRDPAEVDAGIRSRLNPWVRR